MEKESSFTADPEEDKMQTLEEKLFPEDLGREVKSYHVGDRFFTVDMVVKEKDTDIFGKVISMRKEHDPIYHMQQKTMLAITIELQGESQKEIKAWEATPVYKLMGGSLESTVIKEVPEDYQRDFSLKIGDREFKIGQTVKIAGQIRTIVMIIPEENPQIVVTAQNRKGHKCLFKVSPEALEIVE